MKQLYDRVHNTPDSKTDIIKIPEAYGKWKVRHVGCYLGKYGVTSYVDIYTDEKNIKRFYLHNYDFKKIDELSHDDKFMYKVQIGKIDISIRSYYSLRGCVTFLYDFVERKEK